MTKKNFYQKFDWPNIFYQIFLTNYATMNVQILSVSTTILCKNVSLEDWSYARFQVWKKQSCIYGIMPPYKYANSIVGKYASIRACIYASIQIYRYWSISYASMKACMYPCIKVEKDKTLQVFRHASIQVCNHASMYVSKYANMQESKYDKLKVFRFTSMWWRNCVSKQPYEYAIMWNIWWG